MEASSLAHHAASWEVYPQLEPELFRAASAHGITPLQAQLLHNRGCDSIEKMQRFLSADYSTTLDPLRIIDMPKAVERVLQALHNKEHITVYGDYDADGVTSSSLLFRALRKLKHDGARLDYHIPHRQKDGCGLNLAALDLLKARGTQLIITTDCASSDVAQVHYAQETLGIDVIITDHHHPPAEIPPAYAMVNPWRQECQSGERYLCGVGIAFKLAQALYRASERTIGEVEEQELLDLVAIGTIGDIAPLVGDNHTLVHQGLDRLNTTQKPGLQALIRLAGLQPGHIRERDIAFSLAPRINAAGRMKEASIAFELMTTDSKEEAERIAQELQQLNEWRKTETEELMKNARTQAKAHPDHAVVLVAGDNWHEGIIGLVAGKLAEEINKPVLVLSNNPASKLSRGSARSQKGFNIIEALKRFSQHLERYGGHAQAAGFTIQTERIDELRAHLLAWEASGGEADTTLIEGTEEPDPTGLVTEQEGSESPFPSTVNKVDLIFTRLERLSYQTYEELRALAPFGAGNPEPVFKMEHLSLLKSWTSGKNLTNLGLRFTTNHSDTATGHESRTAQALSRSGTFIRGAAQQKRIENASHVNLIFRIETYKEDDKKVWLNILDVESGK